MSYNYLEAMKADVKDYINNEVDLSDYDTLEELQENLQDDLWDVDSVTGNGSGSYTFNSEEAKGYVLENIDLLNEACEDFCVEASEIGQRFLDEDFEWMDVTIRCCLLSTAITEVVEDLEDEFNEIHEDDEEEEEEQ